MIDFRARQKAHSKDVAVGRPNKNGVGFIAQTESGVYLSAFISHGVSYLSS